MEQIIKTRNTTINLNTLFNLCTPIEDSLGSDQDQANLYLQIAETIASVVQYSRENIGEGEVETNNIISICRLMNDISLGRPVERLGAVIKKIKQSNCLAYNYNLLINNLKNENLYNDPEDTRQWWYQRCTELGWFHTSSGEPHTFGNKFPIGFFIQICADVFGKNFTGYYIQSGIDKTNQVYGGLNVYVTNVIFTHGTVDPWHRLGIRCSDNAFVIKG